MPVNGFKDLQGSDGPRHFTIEKSGDYREVIRVLTGWIYRRIQIMRVWRASCCLLSSEC